MIEVIFLCVLALVWIVFATVQDLRMNEVANWLNYSLIIFALGFRFFYSLFSDLGFSFFYQGLIGLAIFFVVGNMFYYGRLFAGGDAKLMIALGAVLPLSKDFATNLNLFIIFIFLFFFVGAFYGLAISLFMGIKNFKSLKKEFRLQFRHQRSFVCLAVIVAVLFLILGFFNWMFIFLGLFAFLLPYLYLYAKSVDEACMVKKLRPSKLREGDWLYKGVKVGKKFIRATWDGLGKEDIKLLKKRKKEVLVRYGIAFVPVFLISFVIFTVLYFLGYLDFYFLYTFFH